MRLNPDRKPTVILCGPGNNGGDGFVIARHLDNAGWPVKVWVFAPANVTQTSEGWVVGEPKLSADAAVNFRIWQHERDVPIVDQDTRAGPPGWPKLVSDDIRTAGWVVDSLFGTGLTRMLALPYAIIIATLTGYGTAVLAVDIPSGLDCDTGEPLGPCVKATHTATFVAPKRGFLNRKSKEWTGEVHVIDIGAPRVLVDEYRQRHA
jgi:NAD(P)H-hydrate epimerase